MRTAFQVPQLFRAGDVREIKQFRTDDRANRQKRDSIPLHEVPVYLSIVSAIACRIKSFSRGNCFEPLLNKSETINFSYMPIENLMVLYFHDELGVGTLYSHFTLCCRAQFHYSLDATPNPIHFKLLLYTTIQLPTNRLAVQSSKRLNSVVVRTELSRIMQHLR